METLINLPPEEITRLVVITAVLLIVLFLARLAFKLTATLVRLGCLTIFLIVMAIAILRLFGGS